jgi:hypothetical protein
MLAEPFSNSIHDWSESMPFIKIGNRVINTMHIAMVELHHEEPAFDPPDLEPEGSDSSGESRPAMMADLVRVHFRTGDAVTFYHNEAKALRDYFTDAKDITDIMTSGSKENVGFR